MKINKSQGQTLHIVGLYLPRLVFTYGQLYVAISIATHPKGLKILIYDSKRTQNMYTANIIYKEILECLP
ncbi:hypothetical protein PTKIN_Ptkin12aG0087200 [Pterospermum kingtungense]